MPTGTAAPIAAVTCWAGGRLEWRAAAGGAGGEVELAPGQDVLLYRGRLHAAGAAAAAVPWRKVACRLAGVPPDPAAVAQELASHPGRYWLLHARRPRVATAAAWVCVATDTMGMLPLFCAACPAGHCFVASVAALDEQQRSCRECGAEMAGQRPCSPRLVQSWAGGGGGGGGEIGPAATRPFVNLLHCGRRGRAAVPPPAVFSGHPCAARTAELVAVLRRAVGRCLPAGPRGARVGVLFSGGLDSTTLAVLCKQHFAAAAGAARGGGGEGLALYTVGFGAEGRQYPEDLDAAEKAAGLLNLRSVRKLISLTDVSELLADSAAAGVVDWNVVKAGVAVTMLSACQLAAADGASVVLSGLGSEEVFGGYHRHANARRQLAIKSERASAAGMRLECAAGLAQMYHRDLQRDFATATAAGVTICYPYLDPEVVAFGLAAAEAEVSAGEAKEIVADGWGEGKEPGHPQRAGHQAADEPEEDDEDEEEFFTRMSTASEAVLGPEALFEQSANAVSDQADLAGPAATSARSSESSAPLRAQQLLLQLRALSAELQQSEEAASERAASGGGDGGSGQNAARVSDVELEAMLVPHAGSAVLHPPAAAVQRSSAADRKKRKRKSRAARRATKKGMELPPGESELAAATAAADGGVCSAGGSIGEANGDAGSKEELRLVAKLIGVPQAVCDRKKRAAQYGSRVHYVSAARDAAIWSFNPVVSLNFWTTHRQNRGVFPGPAHAGQVAAAVGGWHGRPGGAEQKHRAVRPSHGGFGPGPPASVGGRRP